MAEDTRIPLLEHEPSESPVFTAASLAAALEAALEHTGRKINPREGGRQE